MPIIWRYCCRRIELIGTTGDDQLLANKKLATRSSQAPSNCRWGFNLGKHEERNGGVLLGLLQKVAWKEKEKGSERKTISSSLVQQAKRSRSSPERCHCWSFSYFYKPTCILYKRHMKNTPQWIMFRKDHLLLWLGEIAVDHMHRCHSRHWHHRNPHRKHYQQHR